MIDLTGTGLRVRSDVTWKTKSDNGGMEIQDFKFKEGLVVSAKCGGWCGSCKPRGKLVLELVSCGAKFSKCFLIIDRQTTN